jgi:hypothetical protein
MTTSAVAPVVTAAYRVKFRKENQGGQSCLPEKVPARVPRVARLLALAHRIDGMIRSGELKNWAEAARIVGVARSRMTQIAQLLLISPALQGLILESSASRFRLLSHGDRPFRLILRKSLWHQQQLATARRTEPTPGLGGHSSTHRDV